MSEAPEKIWASKSTSGTCVVSFSSPSKEYCIEYTRTDCIPNDPRVKALVRAAWIAGRNHTAKAIKFACLDNELGEWMLVELLPCILPEHDHTLAAMEPRHE